MSRLDRDISTRLEMGSRKSLRSSQHQPNCNGTRHVQWTASTNSLRKDRSSRYNLHLVSCLLCDIISNQENPTRNKIIEVQPPHTRCSCETRLPRHQFTNAPEHLLPQSAAYCLAISIAFGSLTDLGKSVGTGLTIVVTNSGITTLKVGCFTCVSFEYRGCMATPPACCLGYRAATLSISSLDKPALSGFDWPSR